VDRSLRITGKRPGPELLVLGGVHGDEYEPIQAIRQLADRVDPAKLSGQLLLIPIANGPAFESHERGGPDGLDLARTFPCSHAASQHAHGTVTQRIAERLATRIAACDFLIDLHTGGRAMTIWPLTGYMLCKSPDVLDTQRRMARAFGLPLIWGTSPQLEGRSLSVARDAGKPAIYAEWGGGSGCDPAGVTAYVEGCLNVMSELNMYAARTLAATSQTMVEDPRDGSGHLQSNYPAPHAGFYQPAQPLGQIIQPGALLGTIWFNWDEPVTEVRATGGGLLIVNRTLPAVREGDALATILEIDQASSSSGDAPTPADPLSPPGTQS